MDGQEYLNQISASNRPVKNQSKAGKIFSSIYFKLIAGALVVLIIIMIVGAALSGGKGGAEQQLTVIKLRMDRTMTVIQNYQSSVKSSNLRSSSASLYGVLSNTNTQITAYISEKYGAYKEKSVEKKLLNEADANRDELDSDLFNAKITGMLDRTYAHKMAYEIFWFAQKESSLADSTKDGALKEMLDTSVQSLENLYNNFNDFSETK